MISMTLVNFPDYLALKNCHILNILFLSRNLIPLLIPFPYLLHLNQRQRQPITDIAARIPPFNENQRLSPNLPPLISIFWRGLQGFRKLGDNDLQESLWNGEQLGGTFYTELIRTLQHYSSYIADKCILIEIKTLNSLRDGGRR